MITNRRVNIDVDNRGRIKCGMKGLSSSGREIPKSTDYFVISAFPELVACYGEKPQKLLVYPPADNLEAIFEDNYALYGGGSKEKPGTKLRLCDGTRCTHRIAEVVEYMNEDGTRAKATFGQGEVTDCICQELGLFASQDKEIKKKACKYSMYARLFVANPLTGKVESPRPILFESHSLNSGAAVHDALENMAVRTAQMSGGTPLLYGLAFELEVRMVEGKTDAKQKFPIWRMSPIGTLAEIGKRMNQIAVLMGRSDEVKRLIASREPESSGPSMPAAALPPAISHVQPALEEDPVEDGQVDPDNPLGIGR